MSRVKRLPVEDTLSEVARMLSNDSPVIIGVRVICIRLYVYNLVNVCVHDSGTEEQVEEDSILSEEVHVGIGIYNLKDGVEAVEGEGREYVK